MEDKRRERTEMEIDGGGGGQVVLRLIEKATNSTDREVDPRLLKAIKSTVRSSDEEVRLSAHALIDKMKKEHSQVRYLAVLIIDELFMRSKLFRTLLVVNFDQFLSLSVGFRRNLPLPPPSAIASLLRSKSIELLEKWNARFGIHYRQLRLGFDYLKNTLRFQFPNHLENEARMQQERREREIRSREILLNKFKSLNENYSLIKSEIQSTLDQIGECLDMVCVEEDFIQSGLAMDDEADSNEYKSSVLRQIRLDSLKEGAKVHENSDNKAVFDALRELYKLIVSKHLQSVQECISILVRVDLPDNRFRDSALKEFIDIRNLICSAKTRCEESGCVHDPNDNEDDIWEEGTMEVNEPKNSSGPNKSSDNSAGASVKNKNKGKAPCDQDMPSTRDGPDPASPRSRLLAKAPVMTCGSFLDNWGSNRDALANQRGLELENHWGRVDYDAVIPAAKIAELNVHVTPYKEPEVEIKPCLAPLKKGGLCQRRDLKVCPFHGPIVPRDAMGNPIEKQPSTRGETSYESSKKANISSVEVERTSDSSNELARKLAKQAVKNVRERENDMKALKRAKLAKVRKHNEDVLREAAVASTSHSGGFSDDAAVPYQGRPEVKMKKPTLASMLRKRVTTKDRLAQRLLNTRVTDAAVRQLTQGEDAVYREAYPNQW